MKKNKPTVIDSQPIILGLNPPTKAVFLTRISKPLEGIACIIQEAGFPEGARPGDMFDMFSDEIKRGEIACWIQFANFDVMRRFGQMLIDYADGKPGG